MHTHQEKYGIDSAVNKFNVAIRMLHHLAIPAALRAAPDSASAASVSAQRHVPEVYDAV
jgi:hypothetical protein